MYRYQEPSNTLPTDLEWMLQDNQVSDIDLAEALLKQYFADIYRLGLAFFSDPAQGSKLSREVFAEVVARRRKFWGEASLKEWLATLAFKRISKWSKPSC